MRQVFFSFHYENDNHRASLVRNMWTLDDSSPISDNDWEEVKEKTDTKIKAWIDKQFEERSCLVVLIGEKTANRKWINYEIKKAVELNKGIVGIYIHNLKDLDGKQSKKGKNPFDFVIIDGEKISKYIKCFESKYLTSKRVYMDIKNNIEDLVESALAEKFNL